MRGFSINQRVSTGGKNNYCKSGKCFGFLHLIVNTESKGITFSATVRCHSILHTDFIIIWKTVQDMRKLIKTLAWKLWKSETGGFCPLPGNLHCLLTLRYTLEWKNTFHINFTLLVVTQVFMLLAWGNEMLSDDCSADCSEQLTMSWWDTFLLPLFSTIFWPDWQEGS